MVKAVEPVAQRLDGYNTLSAQNSLKYLNNPGCRGAKGGFTLAMMDPWNQMFTVVGILLAIQLSTACITGRSFSYLHSVRGESPSY